MRMYAAGMILIMLLSGCAGKKLTVQQESLVEELRQFQLYIDEYGNLLSPASQKIIPADEEQAYVENIIKNFQRIKTDKAALGRELVLTVFIHGGLNTFDSATRRVRLFKDDMLEEGHYPLFISWNSGPVTNYKDHLFRNRRGISTSVLGYLSSPFVFLEDALRAIARVPASTYNVLFGQNTLRRSDSTKEVVAAKRSLANLSSEGFNVYQGPEGEVNLKDWATVWNPSKLVTAPVLDGLGTGAWNAMLRRADLVLRKDSGFNGQAKNGSHTAVTRFFTRYEEEFAGRGVDLIGHSMGAIIANNIVAKYPDLNFQNIVYMGAACRIKDLEYVVYPYLKNNETARFYNLSINTYREISENSFYDFLPRGSLLVWIDQIFGSTNSFVDRTAGYWYNIVRAAANVFKGRQVRERVYLTEFAKDGDVPKKHGAFDEFNFWQENFWLGNRVTRYDMKAK